jgi:hypothetical protein
MTLIPSIIIRSLRMPYSEMLLAGFPCPPITCGVSPEAVLIILDNYGNLLGSYREVQSFKNSWRGKES